MRSLSFHSITVSRLTDFVKSRLIAADISRLTETELSRLFDVDIFLCKSVKYDLTKLNYY